MDYSPVLVSFIVEVCVRPNRDISISTNFLKGFPMNPFNLRVSSPTDYNLTWFIPV